MKQVKRENQNTDEGKVHSNCKIRRERDTHTHTERERETERDREREMSQFFFSAANLFVGSCPKTLLPTHGLHHYSLHKLNSFFV